jgi:hypothetical protein
MINGFNNAYTRFTPFGFGWNNGLFAIDIQDFVGLTELEVVAGGCIKLMFIPDVDAVLYNIYLRPDNNDIFHDEYLLGKFPNLPLSENYYGDEVVSAKVRTEANPGILLQDTKFYYVGVKAENAEGVEDGNFAILSVRPLGTAQVYVFVNDRHISLVT